MRYLLDTNVLSELRRRQPNPGVASWVGQRPPTALYLSVLTIGELRNGVDRLTEGDRRRKLREWLATEVSAFFNGRILPVDLRVAEHWGQLLSRMNRPLPAIDSLLAATALAHGMTLVTRNRRDFEIPGLELIDPWGAH